MLIFNQERCSAGQDSQIYSAELDRLSRRLGKIITSVGHQDHAPMTEAKE